MYDDGVTQHFEADRARLRAIARRMLGSEAEAEDVVQEAWLRLSRTDTAQIGNVGGWLTTVVSRLCLDALRGRRAPPVAIAGEAEGVLAPVEEIAMADAVGVGLSLVLDALSPDERVAFVLHDVFDLPFDDIAPMVGRTPEAARQLASRARRRIRGANTTPTDPTRRAEVVAAFLTASREGDFDALLALLAPGAVLRADAVAVRMAAANRNVGAPVIERETHGRAGVAQAFLGRARGATPVRIDGAAGAVWRVDGTVRAAFLFTVVDDQIVGIEIVMEPGRLGTLDVR